MTQSEPRLRDARERTRSREEKRAALSRDLSELLLELSIGAHRYAMYPPGHPSLGPVVENVIGRLGEIFRGDRRSLSIGVARRQLVIEGAATDAKHPVLADLAKRLHEHQIAAISFQQGVRTQEVVGLLTALAEDAGRQGEPVGLRPPEELPSWPHVQIHPVGYDRLAIRDEETAGDGSDPAQELWLGLARAALAAERPLGEEEADDVTGMARRIREHAREAAYDEVIVGYLRQLAEELKDRDTGEAAKVRRRMSALIAELDDPTLERLVEMGGHEERRRFVLDANQGLAVDAVMKVLKAAAQADRQTISTSLTRMLSKLATHASGGAGRLARQADTALRENVEQLISDWQLADPNPDEYTALLDAMSTASPLFERTTTNGELAGPERIVKMALEVEAWGTTVEKAVLDMLDREMSGALLGLVEGANDENRTATTIRGYLARPGPLRRLLAGRDVDEAALERLVDHMGEAAVDPLLEVLAESDSRSVRRKVFDALSRLGPTVGERALERLDDPRWFVVRNMLALLGRLEVVPEDFDPLDYTRHGDPRVRREAFVLAFKDGSLRARTLAQAMGENDERLVRMALLELKDGIPETLVPTVVNRALKGDHPPELRAMAARALRDVRSPLVRDALLGACRSGTSIFGRTRLADPSPLVLAALQVLAERWASDDGVRPVLEAAARSKDPAFRRAVGEVG